MDVRGSGGPGGGSSPPVWIDVVGLAIIMLLTTGLFLGITMYDESRRCGGKRANIGIYYNNSVLGINFTLFNLS